MKKKLLLALAFIFLSANISDAKTQFGENLSRMEKSLFGIEYTNQNETKRVERLEDNVYGKISKGNIHSRIEKLSKDLNAEMIGQEIKPKKDTFDEEEDYFERKEKADANVNYPIIDELENKAFNKTFKNLNLEKRLENLEKKAFSKNYNDDFSTRTERLKTALLLKNNSYLPEVYPDTDSYNQYNSYSNSQEKYPNKYEKYSDNENFSNFDTNIALSQLEKQILRHTYKNEDTSTRLVRLETKMFSTTFTQDDTQTRLDRIASAHQASKSSQKYDDNKFAQKMATAMQIGAFVLMILASIL